MIFETSISEYYRIVQSNDEPCYKYIIGKLKEAKEIYIMTFGDTERNRELEVLLSQCKGKVHLISDINNKYSMEIGKLLNGINGGVNFDNTTKLIMTEKAAFIGSENNSFSSGFLTIDVDVVDEIRENLFKYKDNDNNISEYMGYEFTRLEIMFMNYYSKVNRILEDIIKDAFKEDEKGNGYYNSISASINWNDILWINKTIDEFTKTIETIEEKQLKDALSETFDKSNLEALQELCNSRGAMFELGNISSEDQRKDLANKSEKEIIDLYEKINVFQEELYGIVEQMIDIKSNQ